jgi:hypothetical protein
VAKAKTHTGGCHCGSVRYEVTMPLGEVMQCNCSICSKTGALLAFAPADQFRLLSGGDRLTDYQFGKKFARGTGPDGKEMAAINVRCLDGVDLSALKVNEFDGASL